MAQGVGPSLRRDPLFGASLLAVAGYLLFMTSAEPPQPRYFALPAFFCFFVVALGARRCFGNGGRARGLGWAAVALCRGGGGRPRRTDGCYALHPEYTFVNAASTLTSYIDTHPNGKRLLVSISGDEITLITHLPTLCDDFGAQVPAVEARRVSARLVCHVERHRSRTWKTCTPFFA